MCRKTSRFCMLLFIILLLTSCVGGENSNDDILNNGGFIFTKIDSGMIWVLNMYSNSTRVGTVYLSGCDVSGNESFVNHPVNEFYTDDLSYKPLNYSAVIDDGCYCEDIYPLHDGGFLILQNYIDTRVSTERLCKFCTYDFKVVSSYSLSETYNNYLIDDVWMTPGCTPQGELVIWFPGLIYVLNTDGSVKQKWDIETPPNHIVRTLVSGDEIYISEFAMYSDLGGTKIKKLLPDGSIKLLYHLDNIFTELYTDREGQFYPCNSNLVYKLNEDGEVEFLFDCRSAGLSAGAGLEDLIILPDDSYLAKIQSDVYYISRNADAVPKKSEKTVLRLACYNSGEMLREWVYNFNKNNGEFDIEIIDYGQYEDGVARLSIDMIAGKAPDMFSWGMGFSNELDPDVFSNAGYLVDLYSLMDKDGEITRSTLLPNLQAALEKDGALYELPVEFSLQVVAADVKDVGTEPGWTFDDYFTLVKKYPETEYPFGTLWWSEVLRLAIANNYDAFVNWDNSECYFETEEFMRIVQMAEIYESEYTVSLLPIKYIQQGKLYLSLSILGSVSSIQGFKALYGGDVNLVGFPTTKGVGNSFMLWNSLSISVMSEHIDACWEFLKSFVNYKGQMKDGMLFPVNHEVLLEQVFNPSEYEVEGSGVVHLDTEGDRWTVTFTDPTLEESEQVWQAIINCDRVYRENRFIMSIIKEEVPYYFNGDKTVEEVARLIQARVTIYINEQKK